MSKLGEKVKTVIRNWLQVQPAAESSIVLQEPLSFRMSVIRARTWYRGEAAELDQLYKQLGASDTTNAARFWAAAPLDLKLRKIHSGLPAILVDTLAYLVKSDMDDVSFKGDGADEWEAISKEIDFADLVGKGIVGALSSGDGAWKISVDAKASEYPIVEFFEADRVEYLRRHGKIIGVDFWSQYQEEGKPYRLRERYERGSVAYSLFSGEQEVSIESVKALADLKDAQFDGSYLMAVPLKFYDSPKFSGRGKPVYDGKMDDFDALDEVVSQWWEAIRAGRVKKYIPRDLLPIDARTGDPTRPNDFGSEYITLESDKTESAVNKIEVVQPEIRYEAFLASYTAALDMCLQGIVSPATLGIDIGKMSSADAQREKKDVTGYTRNVITGVLEKALSELVCAVLNTYNTMRGKLPGNYDPSVSFGEYGAPGFDARVETVNKAAVSNTMSIETQVEELWGNSRDKKWKGEEIARIKQMRGIEALNAPPSIGEEWNGSFMA